MNFFNIEQLPRTAWKNGGGTTREIMTCPQGSDLSGFDWRVSVATISASGPFSTFTGIDRVIMLLDGDGVWLRGAGISARLEQQERPFAFSGDEQLSSELLGGESTDFNVMTRRSVATASLEIIDASCTVATLDGGLVMGLSGSWSIGERVIAKGQGCWWAEGAEACHLTKTSADRAALLLVSWIRF